MSDRRRVPDLGVQPLTARSLVLSALLGSHPPRLPVQALVALGELFGLPGGTIRTALSRLAAAGEVSQADGVYGLSDRMQERQAVQDAGRVAPAIEWDGTWWVAIAAADVRPLGERRAFRSLMRHRRFGELRPDIWMRPANIAELPTAPGVLATRGPILAGDAHELVGRLWPLDELSASGHELIPVVENALGWLEDRDPAVLPDTFMVSVAAYRYLLGEPRLPAELVPPDWPADALRAAYDRFDAAHMALMRAFLTREAAPTRSNT